MSVTTPGIGEGAGRQVLAPALVPGLNIAAALTGEEGGFASVLRDVPVSGVAPAAGKTTVSIAETDPGQASSSKGDGLAMPDIPGSEAVSVAPNGPKVEPSSRETGKKVADRAKKEAPRSSAEIREVREPVISAQAIPVATPVSGPQQPVPESPKPGEAGATVSRREAVAGSESKIRPVNRHAEARSIGVADDGKGTQSDAAAAMSAESSPFANVRVVSEASIEPPARNIRPRAQSTETRLPPRGYEQPVPTAKVAGQEDPSAEPQIPVVQSGKPESADPELKVKGHVETGDVGQEPKAAAVMSRGGVHSSFEALARPDDPVTHGPVADTAHHENGPSTVPAASAGKAQPVLSERQVATLPIERATEATALLDLVQSNKAVEKAIQPLVGVFGRTSPPESEIVGRIADGIVRVPPSPARDKGALSRTDAAEKLASTPHSAAAAPILAQLRPAAQNDTAMNDTVIVADARSPADTAHAERSGPAAAEGHMPAVAEKAQKMLQDVRASLAGLFGKSRSDTPQAHDHAVEPGRGDIMATRITPDSPPVLGAVSVSPPSVAMPSGEFTVSGALGRQVVDMGVSGQWIEDIAREVASIATNPGHGSFRIVSDNLGAVRVDIRPGPQGSDIVIATDSEAAQAALSQDRERLVQDARLASIRIGEVRIEKIAAPGEAARGDMQGNSQQGAGTSHPGGQPQSGGQSASMNGGGQHGQHGQQGGRPDASTFAGDGQRGNNPKTSFTQSVLNDAAIGRGEAERGGSRVDRARYA